jgi:hypothetical protein
MSGNRLVRESGSPYKVGKEGERVQDALHCTELYTTVSWVNQHELEYAY